MIITIYKRALVKRGTLLLGGLLFIAALCTGVVPVSAATTNSIYSYDFTGVTSSSTTVSNGAAANGSVNLNLYGNWTPSAVSGGGVHFDGDTVSKQSVAYGRPATGNTINASASQAVGIAARFTYDGLPVGQFCEPDSHNIAQIGRFGAGLSQVKLQMSSCAQFTYAVFPECRIAGTNSTTADEPVASSQPLVKGKTYIVRCYKAPDPASGNATVTLEVTQVNPTYGNRTSIDTFSITPTGAIQSTAYMSVANKYQLPTIATNTDQFVGDVAKVSVCQASTATAVNTCLDTEIPDPIVPTPEREWITNTGVETDLTGWGGRYGESEYVTVEQSTEQAHSGSASVKVAGITGAVDLGSGFSDSNPRFVSNTTTGEAYNGSVWVKPGFVGQTINFRLREWTPSNTLVTDNQTSLTATSTNWQQMTNSITGTYNGNRIAFIVQAENIDDGEYFYADDMSLHSTLTAHEWVDNNGLETDLTGWTGTYNSSPYIEMTQSTSEAHTGSASLKVNALTGATALNSGFSDSPRWLKGMEAGKTYHASFWVKPSFVGQEINLRLREWKWDNINSVNVMYADDKTTYTAATTNWQKVERDFTATEQGTDLSFIVYGLDMDAGEYFHVDDLSITSLE